MLKCYSATPSATTLAYKAILWVLHLIIMRGVYWSGHFHDLQQYTLSQIATAKRCRAAQARVHTPMFKMFRDGYDTKRFKMFEVSTNNDSLSEDKAKSVLAWGQLQLLYVLS